ncbi:hypothetical protein ACMATS_27310 [Streptoverticillium reticulum]|nr:hypothetical protein GCM10010359_39840 [Streptomyces morookaense]
MPQPPSIPLNAWCVIAVAATVLFLLFFLPLMPNRRYRMRMFLGPVIGIVVTALSSLVKNFSPEVALALYSAAIVGFPLGCLGRRKELREKTLDMAENGQSAKNAWSKGLQQQLVVVIIVVALVGSWLSMAS